MTFLLNKPIQVVTLMSPVRYLGYDGTKYLGVHLTTNLRWNLHIDQRLKKCKSKIMMIHKALSGKFGPKPGLLSWAYKAIICPTMTYALHIFGHQKWTK